MVVERVVSTSIGTIGSGFLFWSMIRKFPLILFVVPLLTTSCQFDSKIVSIENPVLEKQISTSTNWRKCNRFKEYEEILNNKCSYGDYKIYPVRMTEVKAGKLLEFNDKLKDSKFIFDTINGTINGRSQDVGFTKRKVVLEVKEGAGGSGADSGMESNESLDKQANSDITINEPYSYVVRSVMNAELEINTILRRYNFDVIPGNEYKLYAIPIDVFIDFGMKTREGYKVEMVLEIMPVSCPDEFKLLAVAPMGISKSFQNLNSRSSELLLALSAAVKTGKVNVDATYAALLKKLREIESIESMPEVSIDIIDNHSLKISYFGRNYGIFKNKEQSIGSRQIKFEALAMYKKARRHLWKAVRLSAADLADMPDQGTSYNKAFTAGLSKGLIFNEDKKKGPGNNEILRQRAQYQSTIEFKNLKKVISDACFLYNDIDTHSIKYSSQTLVMPVEKYGFWYNLGHLFIDNREIIQIYSPAKDMYIDGQQDLKLAVDSVAFIGGTRLELAGNGFNLLKRIQENFITGRLNLNDYALNYKINGEQLNVVDSSVSSSSVILDGMKPLKKGDNCTVEISLKKIDGSYSEIILTRLLKVKSTVSEDVDVSKPVMSGLKYEFLKLDEDRTRLTFSFNIKQSVGDFVVKIDDKDIPVKIKALPDNLDKNGTLYASCSADVIIPGKELARAVLKISKDGKEIAGIAPVVMQCN